MKRYLLALPPLLVLALWVSLMVIDKGMAVEQDRCHTACTQALMDAGVSLADAPRGPGPDSVVSRLDRVCGPIFQTHPSCQWPDAMKNVCFRAGQKALHCFDTSPCFHQIVRTCDTLFPWGLWR